MLPLAGWYRGLVPWLAHRCVRAYTLRPDERPASLTAPRHPPHSSLPELRACFLEQRPIRVADLQRESRWHSKRGQQHLWRVFLDAIGRHALNELANECDEAQPTLSLDWSEVYTELSQCDTLLLGLRAIIRYEAVPSSRFEHRYIAWSKEQRRVAAQGGATILCGAQWRPRARAQPHELSQIQAAAARDSSSSLKKDYRLRKV